MKKIQELISIAKNKMGRSSDPVHDLSHVERVVANTKDILGEYKKFSEEERCALVLSAWWHDIGRTVTDKPSSFVFLTLVDDIISALFLVFYALKKRSLNKIVVTSIFIILCKSMGAGAILTKLFLNKKHRKLLYILKDADALDLIHTGRVEQACKLADESRFGKYSYKIAIWWVLHRRKLEFRTEEARIIFEQALEDFVSWLEKEKVHVWHVLRFGEKYTQNNKAKFKLFLSNLNQA